MKQSIHLPFRDWSEVDIRGQSVLVLGAPRHYKTSMMAHLADHYLSLGHNTLLLIREECEVRWLRLLAAARGKVPSHKATSYTDRELLTLGDRFMHPFRKLRNREVDNLHVLCVEHVEDEGALRIIVQQAIDFIHPDVVIDNDIMGTATAWTMNVRDYLNWCTNRAKRCDLTWFCSATMQRELLQAGPHGNANKIPKGTDLYLGLYPIEKKLILALRNHGAPNPEHLVHYHIEPFDKFYEVEDAPGVD